MMSEARVDIESHARESLTTAADHRPAVHGAMDPELGPIEPIATAQAVYNVVRRGE